jgi:hypothetical protein
VVTIAKLYHLLRSHKAASTKLKKNIFAEEFGPDKMPNSFFYENRHDHEEDWIEEEQQPQQVLGLVLGLVSVFIFLKT